MGTSSSTNGGSGSSSLDYAAGGGVPKQIPVSDGTIKSPPKKNKTNDQRDKCDSQKRAEEEARKNAAKQDATFLAKRCPSVTNTNLINIILQ